MKAKNDNSISCKANQTFDSIDCKNDYGFS
jgi:hypothetical protein